MKQDIVDIEWELWRDLCTRLEETGLVTKADLRSSVSENGTKGQSLLHAIRAYGEDRSNEIARLTVVRLINGEEYVLTAVREWAQARALLPKGY